MMMHRTALAAALLLWTTASAGAVGTSLTLLETMELARRQAREITAAQAQARAGAAQLRQAKGFRWPQLTLQEIWLTTNNPAEVFALQLNQGRFSFPDFVMSDPNRPDWFDNATTRFLLTLPLYTGGEVSGRVDQARLAAQAAEIEAVWTADVAALAAAEAYVRLAQVRENIVLLERSEETVEAHVNLARAYVEQGMLVRSELLRAEVERSRIQDLLTTARGQARVAEANLSFRVGADLASQWQLESMADPVPMKTELEQWLVTADTRADLEAARRLLEAGELEIKVQRSGLLPKVGLMARYDFYDDSLFGSSGDSGSIAAVASIDLFSGNRHRAARASAEAEWEAGAEQLRLFEQGVQVEVRGAFEKSLSARERHETARSAQLAAKEAERITEERFKKGIVKMIDLLDASTARQEADTRELVARADAHLAALELAVKSGRAPESVLQITTKSNSRTES
jgi:outer membrane protein TolC